MLSNAIKIIGNNLAIASKPWMSIAAGSKVSEVPTSSSLLSFKPSCLDRLRGNFVGDGSKASSGKGIDDASLEA